MLSILILVFREALEASLMVGLLAAASAPISRRWAIVWGVGLGAMAALGVALAAAAIASSVHGTGEEWFNAIVLLLAVCMIGWHLATTARRPPSLRERPLATSVSAWRLAIPLMTAVAIAVSREGSEIVLFGAGAWASGVSRWDLLCGTGLGLFAGALAGATLCLGLLRLPLGRVFATLNGLLIGMAAGMAATAAGFLEQADVLPPWIDPLWDSSRWLDASSWLGRSMHALLGYTARPSAMQVLFYVTTAVGLWGLSRRPRPSRSVSVPSVASPAGVSAPPLRPDLDPRVVSHAHTH